MIDKHKTRKTRRARSIVQKQTKEAKDEPTRQKSKVIVADEMADEGENEM